MMIMVRGEESTVMTQCDLELVNHQNLYIYQGSLLPLLFYCSFDVMKIVSLLLFSGKYRWDDGHVSGTVYHGGKDLTTTLTKVSVYNTPFLFSCSRAPTIT